MTAPLRAVAVGKTYPGGHRALDEVGFEVAGGETFGILGANGAGKTTLIRILATLLRPSRGEVRLFGQDPGRHGPAIRRRLGVVSQDCTLDPHLTVRRNLGFHALFFGLDRARRRRAVDEALGWLGLEGCADSPIHTLSGGTRRKVMLARALLAGPELLILDEPTTGLDPEARETVWNRLRAAAAAGTTIVLSTHHRDEAEALCTRIGVIVAGRMDCAGTEALDTWFRKVAHG